MARVTISEYSILRRDREGNVLPVTPKPDFSKGYVPTGSPQSSDTFDPETRFIRVATDTALHMAQDEPATTDHPLIPAGSVEVFGVKGGHVSFIVAS